MIRVRAWWKRSFVVALSALAAGALWESQGKADPLQDYADDCDAMTGTTVPDFTCEADDALVPTTNMFPPGASVALSSPSPADYVSTAEMLQMAFGRPPNTITQVDVMMGADIGLPEMVLAKTLIPTCDNPNRLNAECDPGTYFHVLHRNDEDGAFVFALCRPKGDTSGGFRDIGVIQTNIKSGATCFYSSDLSSTSLDGDVKAPSDGLSGPDSWGSWMAPSVVATQDCHGCHDNGAMIRSPFLTQIKSGPNTLPGVNERTFAYNRVGSPYRFVGDDFASWKTWEVTATTGGCTDCHRIGTNNGSHRDYRHGGAALNFGMWATALELVPGFTIMDFELGKNANIGPWMPPEGFGLEPYMWQAADFYRECAETFRLGGTLPAWCSLAKSSASNTDCDPISGGCASDSACTGLPTDKCFNFPPPSADYREMLESMFYPRDPLPQEYDNGFENLGSGFSYDALFRDQVQPRSSAQATGIVIDGALDATGWAGSPLKTLIQTVDGVSAPSTDSAAGWRTTWDSRNLYFFVSVSDDVRIADNGPGEFYKDDSVELYIDGRDRRNPTYAGGQDWQLVLRCTQGALAPTAPTGRLPATLAKELGANSAALALNQVTASCADHVGEEGYDVELSIPWASLNVPSGNRMAMEVHVNDDDIIGNAGRETQQAWRAPTANAWQDPRQMTAVELADEVRSTVLPFVVGNFGGNAVWSSTTAHDLKNKPLGADASADTATWKATFDSQKLYVLVAVNDDQPRTPNSTQAHNDDSVEIYLDADHSMNWSSYGALDAQLIVRNSGGCGGVEFGANGLQSGSGITRCVFQRSNGYDVELGIPWSVVGGFPGTGARIGFDVHVNDDDSPGSDRDYKRAWFSKDDRSWTEPATFGSLRLMGLATGVTPIAQHTAAPFVLDGANTSGEWDSFVQRGIDNLVTGTAGTGSKWRAAWVQDYLYVFVTVPDTSIRTGSTQWWNDDSVELFFDGDRSRNTTMDLVNDRQMVFRVWATDSAQSGPNSQPFGNTVVRWANLVGQAGYSAEIRIPWQEVSVFGELGSGFGFDVQVNDDDTGGNRGGKRAWKATTDNTWQNASLMASVGLSP